jgi:hypothetical protein
MTTSGESRELWKDLKRLHEKNETQVRRVTPLTAMT